MRLLQSNIPAGVLPPDGGIVYTETDMSRLIPEPLNTLTASLFTVIAIYWLIRLKGFSRQLLFLSLSSYLLLVGSVGGTVYHGLRMYRIFILMDWVPILLLCMAASVYFLTKILRRQVYVIGFVGLFFLIQLLIRTYLEKYNHLDWAININYALMAVMVVAPLLFYLFKTGFRYSRLVFSAIGFFSLALFFRIADAWQFLPTGTHFLWHVLGAMATHTIFLYVFQVDTALNDSKRLQEAQL